MPNEPLNRFQNAITRTTATIGVKTSVFVGSAKLNTHITTLKKEITSLTQDLGATVFELWEKEKNDPDRITQQCQMIKEKYESIVALEVEINKLEQQEAEVLGDKKQEDDISPQKAVGFVCPNCSRAFNTPIKFCRKCGTKMA